MHSGEVESFGVPVSIEGYETPVSPENLDVYALERWDVSYFSTLASFWILMICKDHTSFHGVFWVRASIGQTIRGCLISPRTQWSYEERVRDTSLLFVSLTSPGKDGGESHLRAFNFYYNHLIRNYGSLCCPTSG